MLQVEGLPRAVATGENMRESAEEAVVGRKGHRVVRAGDVAVHVVYRDSGP